MTTILDILKNYLCETASFKCTRYIGVCYNVIEHKGECYDTIIFLFEKTVYGNLLCRKLRLIGKHEIYINLMHELIIHDNDLLLGKTIDGMYCRIIKGSYVDLYYEIYEEQWRMFVDL